MRLVLASGSPYRAGLLAAHGLNAEVDPPELDERALDHLFGELGAEGFALELARRKAAVVAARHPDSVVIAGDQVGVLPTADGPVMLTKQPTQEGAVGQLCSMSGTTHLLVGALVLVDTGTARRVEGVDTQRVTFRDITRQEATDYVERYQPFDTAGSYRLEDQDRMGPGEGFVVAVEAEDRSGVLGLPLPLLDRLLAELRSPVSPQRL